MDPGHRLFARYAHAPNALGYCGPATAAALQRVACGGGADVDVPALARQFSGAWPYQLLISEALSDNGIDAAPLSEEVGRAYWTGSDLLNQLDHRAYGQRLLDRFGGQAGHYWAHLSADLLDEVTPTHAFHVLGVYPWSRLLSTGLPEPLHVLDSCRIRCGTVESVTDDGANVLIDTLTYAESQLGLSAPRPEHVQTHVSDGALTEPLRPGTRVAVHWGLICDTLTDADAEHLERSTVEQIRRTNVRLAAS